ncbi:PLDc N-terminal domain-containing protein [Thermococcus argininiproducens]|uniref:PLDc N-terminal domain-containing protein n=1 Tax=Thermococcus argininiproducens TaxID=2866384 RepID=A0A9E7M954_9EURY|nr:PLDc N-terminal domain-containing protein [Thermococcus argininiproducens]USG99654.1 PLDc N-terminal domain-containing protein [Thermococcus argininiproducens]
MLGSWWLISIIIGLLVTVWVIYDIVKNQKDMRTSKKVLWILVAFLFGVVGAIAYYLIVKRKG